MGLTARDWIPIVVFVLGCVAALARAIYLLGRLLKSIDVHGESINRLEADVGHRVKREDHDVANAEMVAHMERMRAEGNLREGRILEAIDSARNQNTAENRILRHELSGVHQRIDRLKDQSPPPDRQRRS